MEYVITIERPFEEIETLTRRALERYGFAVQRTFSLQSAAGPAREQEQTGYSVFLLSRSDAHGRPLGLVALYRRGAQTVIRPTLSLMADADLQAELVGALVQADLEMCIDVVGTERCIDPTLAEEESTQDREQA
jgi:hypothetical protein